MEKMYSKILTDFCCDIRYEDLSKDVIEMAKKCVMDLMGVAISASVKPVAKVMSDYYFMEAQAPQATVWAKGFKKGNYDDVAAYNAALGHVLDFDDVHTSSISHIGVLTVPASLAIGQKYNKPGKDIVTAIAAGYEIAARAGETINPASYLCWHTTGVIGAFASGVATGRLIGLDKKQMLDCVGNAGTQAAGIWEFINDGANSKLLHTANGNLCGMRAALLASKGFTGATRIFEGPRGYAKALASEYDLEALTRNLSIDHLKILENCFKPYACCRHCHPGVYCAETMVKKYDIDYKNIARIKDYTYNVANTHVNVLVPENLYKYKFSLQYCIAARLIYNNLLDPIFTEEKTSNPEVQAFMRKIEVIVDPDITADFTKNPDRWTHRLVITMNDGTEYAGEVNFPYGDWQNPVDWDFMEGKFFGVTDGVIDRSQAEKLAANIRNLENISDVNNLFAF